MATATIDRPTAKGDVVVALSGVSKRYGPIQALEGVNLELRAGEVHCLAGENGAGKSTLIKILSGAIQRDEGSYAIDGRDVGNPSPSQVRDAGVGVVYQELSLLPDLSVGENLMMGRLPARRGITRCSSASASSGWIRARPWRRPRWPSASSSRSPRCSGPTRAC
jgi:ABC-type sugar transport system ATPase subunit